MKQKKQNNKSTPSRTVTIPEPADAPPVTPASLRLQKLRAEIERVAGPGMFGRREDCPPEVEEAFLKHVLAYEQASNSSVTYLEVFTQQGMQLPPAQELGNVEIRVKLDELLGALAARRAFVYHTDHLSDRELYEKLRTQILSEITSNELVDLEMNHHLDLLGSCSDEDIQLSMRYYSDEEERARWMESFPDFDMPPKESPPYDRDRFLPQPPEYDDRDALPGSSTNSGQSAARN